MPASENQRKGNRPVGLTAADGGPADANHSVFTPSDGDMFTERRRAAVAARVVYMFLATVLVRERDDNLRPMQNSGCAYYYSVRDTINQLVASQKPLEHDSFANLLILFVYRTYNPLLQDHKLLQSHRHAAKFRELLAARLGGQSQIPALCAAALRGTVARVDL